MRIRADTRDAQLQSFENYLSIRLAQLCPETPRAPEASVEYVLQPKALILHTSTCLFGFCGSAVHSSNPAGCE